MDPEPAAIFHDLEVVQDEGLPRYRLNRWKSSIPCSRNQNSNAIKIYQNNIYQGVVVELFGDIYICLRDV